MYSNWFIAPNLSSVCLCRAGLLCVPNLHIVKVTNRPHIRYMCVPDGLCARRCSLPSGSSSPNDANSQIPTGAGAIFLHGRAPKGGSQFTLVPESKIKNNMPSASAKRVREKLQFHMQCGEQLLDPAYSEGHQSHWSGISQAAVKETKISFFVPCLRLRWRVLEEIETGVFIQQPGTL